MAINDFFRVTLFQLLYGENIQNVFHYRQAGISTATPAVTLLNQFQAFVLPGLQACQTDDIQYTRVLVQNLMTATDNAEDTTPTPSGGSLPLAAVPTFIAMSFRSNRPDLSKRYAYKRIAGGPNTRILGQDWNPEQMAAMQVAADAMEIVLGTAGGYNFTPAQIVNVAAPSAPPVYVNRYDISVWNPIALITSQDSRKRGRGD